MRKAIGMLILILFTVFFAVGGASAAIQLDFGVGAPTSGSIDYAVLNGPLVGQSIEVDNVVGLNTPLSSGALLNIQDGVLNFTTGNLTSYVAGPISTWTFGGGGSLTINGEINSIGIPPNTNLAFNGSFQSATVVGNGSFFNLLFGGFSDTKDSQLAAYFGVPTNNWTGNFNISFNIGTLNPDGTFTSATLLSGDIVNTVPVPASLLLLGSGLVGLVGLGRKKVFKG